MKISAIKQLVILGVFIVLLPSLCMAVPGLINYQGRLTDSGGAPVTGDKPIVFSIYTTALGSTALWTESRTVTVADGAFSVELGEVTPIPDTVFQTDEVYLGVTVDTDAEMTPRARLTSVGYSYRAAGVNVTSTGSDIPVFVNMSGTGIAGAFQISNSGNSSPAVAGLTNGTGMAGYFVIDNADNTFSPVYAQTNGAGAAVTGMVFGTGKSGDFRISNAANGNAALYGTTTGTGNAGEFRIFNTGSYANGLYASTNGGGDAIKSEVTGTGRAGEFRVLNPSSSAAAVYGLNSGTGNAGYFLVSSTGSAAPAVYANTLGTGPAGKFDGDVQVNGALSATSLTGDGTGLTNVSADTATNADNAALLNSMTSSEIIDAASDEVRIPISSVPFTIMTSMSGKSFYFTGDLVCTQTTGTAITVNANDVTIDMMGYSLKGPGKASGTNFGIVMNARTNVELRNGTIRDFGSDGVTEASTLSKDHRVIDIRSIANGSDGINLYGYNHLIRNCTASDNGGIGIGGQYGCTITGSASYNNQGTGISVNTGCTVTGSTSFINGGEGIYGFSGCTITGNNTYNNQSYGIFGNDGCTITGNTSHNNQYSGIYGYTGCTISGNTANNNNQSDLTDGGGITVYSYCMVNGNKVHHNIRQNICVNWYGNSLEGNVVTYCGGGVGIQFNALFNFYANNRAHGNDMGAYEGSLPIGQGDGGGNADF